MADEKNPKVNEENVEQPAEDKSSKSGKTAHAKPNLPLLDSANEYTMLYYYVKAIRTISLGTGDEIDKIRNTKEGIELFADIANKSLSIAKCNEILAKYGTYFNLVIPGRNEEEKKEALKRYYHQSVRYSKSGEDLPTNEELKEAREEYDRSKIQAEKDARKDTEGLKKTYDEKKTDYKKKHSKLNRARFGVFGAVMLTGLAVATLLAGIGAVATALPLGFSWMSGIGAGIVIGSTFVYQRVKDGLAKLFSKALKKRAEAKNESDAAKDLMKKAKENYKSREKDDRAFAHSLAIDQEYQKINPFPVQGYDPTALSTAMGRDNSEDVKTGDLEKVIIRGPLNNEHDSDEEIKEEEKEVVEEEVEENKKQPPKSNEPKEKTPENNEEETLEINNEQPVEENNEQTKGKGQSVVKEEPAKEVVEEIKEEKEQPKDETVKEVKEEIKEEPSLEVENTEEVVEEEKETPTDKPERKSFVKRIADKAGQVLKRVKKIATKTATKTKVRKAMRKVRIDGNNIEPVYETEHNLQVDAENSDTTVFTTPDGKKQIIIEEAEKPTKSGFTNSGYAEVLKAGGLNDTYANLTVYCRDHNYDLTEAVEHHKSVVAESVKALLGDNASKTSDEEIMKLYTENNGYFYQSIKESVEERLAKEEVEEAAKKPFDEQEYLNWLGAEDKDTAEKLEVYCGKFNVNYEKAYNLHIPVVIEKVRKDLEETYPEATDDEIKEYYDQITVDIIHLAIEANHMEKAPEDKQDEKESIVETEVKEEESSETEVKEEEVDVNKVCQEICDTLLSEANNDDLMSKLIDKNKETIKELLTQGQTKELILDELRNIYKQRKEAIAQENAEKNEEETERGNE